jgi:hypothetical protein
MQMGSGSTSRPALPSDTGDCPSSIFQTPAPKPMLSADERWVMSYNGELYNTAELRREVEEGPPASELAWTFGYRSHP